MNVFIFLIFCVALTATIVVISKVIDKFEHNHAYIKGYDTAKTVWKATKKLPNSNNIPYPEPEVLPKYLKYDFACGYRQAIQDIKHNF